jgi:hypothetical protein
MALPKPFDIMDGRGPADLDATVLAIDALVPTDDRVFEVIRFLLAGEEFDIVRSVP